MYEGLWAHAGGALRAAGAVVDNDDVPAYILYGDEEAGPLDTVTLVRGAAVAAWAMARAARNKPDSHTGVSAGAMVRVFSAELRRLVLLDYRAATCAVHDRRAGRAAGRPTSREGFDLKWRKLCRVVREGRRREVETRW